MGADVWKMSGEKTAAQIQLDGYNTELEKCIAELLEKQKSIEDEIKEEEAKKSSAQASLREQTEKLSRINDSLGRKVSARNEYDTTIQETEAAYLKILESSQTLACHEAPGQVRALQGGGV